MQKRFHTQALGLGGLVLLLGLACASGGTQEKAPCLSYLGCDLEAECQKEAAATCAKEQARAAESASFDRDGCEARAVSACLESRGESG